MSYPLDGIVDEGHTKPVPPAPLRVNGSKAKKPIQNEGEGLFPYQPRANQLEIVNFITENVSQGSHVVMESGTGTGKTVCALSGVLEYTLSNGKRALYVTRTNSQAKQVVVEMRAINERQSVPTMALQGRRSTCPAQRDLGEDLGPAELAKLCEEMKKRTRAGQSGGCRFYENFRRKGPEWWKRFLTGEVPSAEELIDRCERLGCCPREVMRSMLPLAHLVVAPYNYILSKEVREKLLEQMSVEVEDLVIIVDEAHNLPERAREEESFTIDAGLLTSVRQERRLYGNPKLVLNITLDKFLEALFLVLSEGAKRCDGKESVEVEQGFLSTTLNGALGIDKEGSTTLVANLFNHGQLILDQAIEGGKDPVSRTLHLAERLMLWSAVDGSRFLFQARNGESMALDAICLDPFSSLEVFKHCRASVHMSGTLRPLAQYVQVVGLGDRVVRRTFESPFPKENRTVFCATDIDASFESMRNPESVGRMKDHIVRLCNEVDRNTMVFFPSYRVMRQLSLQGLEGALQGKVFREEQGMSQDRLMGMVERFKEERGAVMLTVMGGRVAEGLDFPDEELQMAIIAGIPYPSPTLQQQRLKELYDRRYHKGWEYANEAPAIRKMLQAMGRLIRNETDVGACVILDSRAKRFTSQIEMRMTSDPTSDVLRFFQERGPTR